MLLRLLNLLYCVCVLDCLAIIPSSSSYSDATDRMLPMLATGRRRSVPAGGLILAGVLGLDFEPKREEMRVAA